MKQKVIVQLRKKAFLDEAKFLAKYFSQKFGDILYDMGERYLFVSWEDYGITVNRYEYEDRAKVHLISKSQQDCDIIRFKSIAIIMGGEEFEFKTHKYGLDIIHETRFYYHLLLACKRVNKIKAFL